MKKSPLSLRISHDLLERIRNAVAATPQLSMSELVEQSLEICMQALEEKNGGPFTQREKKLKTGPRI